MAKLTAAAVMVSVQENNYEGKTYAKANLLFNDDGAVMPINIDHKQPDLLGKLKALPQFCKGVATVAIRAIKGTSYIDLISFEASK